MRKESERKGLSHTQQKAIIELISTGNKSLSGIAKKIGVTPRTLNNWLRDQQFQEALSKTMDELRRDAISDSLFACRIEAMIHMVKHESQVIENFDIKGAIIKLGEKQVLIERKLKEISVEQKELRSSIDKLVKASVDKGKG